MGEEIYNNIILICTHIYTPTSVSKHSGYKNGLKSDNQGLVAKSYRICRGPQTSKHMLFAFLRVNVLKRSQDSAFAHLLIQTKASG